MIFNWLTYIKCISGRLPEHTVEAYKLAVEEGADVIECDLAITKVCFHYFNANCTADRHVIKLYWFIFIFVASCNKVNTGAVCKLTN